MGKLDGGKTPAECRGDHEQLADGIKCPDPSGAVRHPEGTVASNSTKIPETSPRSDAESVATDALRSENAALKDRLLRALAETENVRRRGERDLNDMRQYAISKFAEDLLPVADNLQRALASLPAEAQLDGGAVRGLVDGIALTEKELLRVLQKHGIKRLSPLGERFDPHIHEALFEVSDPAVPDGVVTQVVEPGYSIGTRPLRPAKVGVARGGKPLSG